MLKNQIDLRINLKLLSVKICNIQKIVHPKKPSIIDSV